MAFIQSGVHRVQRVPSTDTQGRYANVSSDVAVLQEADKFEVNINEGDIKWDTFRSRAVAGGQNVNKGGNRAFDCAIRGKI